MTTDTKRMEALRRMLAHADHYPHCPQCGRAMLAESAVQFRCPDRHATITLPTQSRWERLRRLLLILTNRTREQSRA